MQEYLQTELIASHIMGLLALLTMEIIVIWKQELIVQHTME